MKQSDFIIAGAERGYTQDEIRTKIKDFRNAGYSFDDDEKPQFTPNAILNTDVRKTMSDEEVSAYNNTTTSQEEAQSTLYAFEGAKRGDSMDTINRGTNGNLYDDLIRLEEGIPDDQDIDYESVLTKRKSEFTEEDDNYFVSNEDRYANAVPQDAPKVTKPELAPFDVALPMRPIRGYYEEVMQGKLGRDLEYNPITGSVVKGSGDYSGNYRYGLYNIATDQRIAFAATRGDKEEVANLIKQKAEVQQAIGSAFDYSDRSYFSPKRATLTATQSAPLMLEQGAIAAPYVIGSAAMAYFSGGTATTASAVIANAGRAVNVAYLQQQGAGTMLEAYLSDKDVASMSDEEFQRATAIANTAGVPYALIERLVNLPSIGKLNFGGVTGAGVNKRLTNYVMNKLMTDKAVGNAVRKGSFILAYRTLGETVEEGLQQIVQESTGMTLEQSDEARSLIADIGAGLKDQANIETIAELSKGGAEAMIEALPSVAVSMGLPSIIETVQTDEFKAAVQEVQMNRAALEKDPVKRRDNINKELKNQGVPEEIALDLAEQAVLAKTPEEIQDIISKANDAVNEFSQAEETDIQVFTTEDWTVARETMSDEDLNNFIGNHPEIRDDFVAGVNGDVKAQERYNAWAKNNRDTDYLEFLIRNKRRDPKFNPRQDDFAVLTPKVVNDLLNTDKYDAKVKKYQREGETLAETKSRVLNQLRNKKAKNIADQVVRIKSALSRIAPNVTIKTYATTEEYNSATGKQGGGFYDKGVIHINEEQASETTVAHEAFHALLENVLTEGTYNDQINRIFEVVMSRGDTELVQRLQEFMALYPDYSEVAQKEEAMAELAGILSTSYTSLPSIRTSIYEFLNKILSVAGIKLANDETEVIGFLRSVERGFSTGTVITEQQVEAIGIPSLEEIQEQDVGGVEQRRDLDKEAKSVKPVKGKEPKKTVKAYKLFRLGKDGKLYPLFVRANEVIPEGEWIEAKMGTLTKDGRIKAERGLKTVAARGGFHAGDYVSATHIGGKGIVGSKKKNNKANYRKPDQVWAEVEFADDVDWQTEANNRAKRNKDGSVNVRTAHITDRVPNRGYYRYKTNPNMKGNWLIGGDMKVVKRLSLEERKEIMAETDIFDLPDLDELVRKENLSLNDLSKTAQNELKKFYPELYKQMSENPNRAMGGVEQRVPTSMEGDIENVSAELLPEDKKQTAIEKLLSGFPPAFSESELGKQITDEKTPASERLDLLINTLKENLKSLYEDVPDDIKERSKLWYDGANAIARDVSARTGFTVDQVGGVIATQSPQKDWFMNVQQALNIIDVYQNHIDEKIDVTAMSDAIDLFVLNPKKESEQQIRRELVEKVNNMSLREALEIDSKEYNAYAGLITRIISLHTHGQSFDILAPEGVPVEIKLKKDGTPAKHGFGSNSEIYKAISILKDGSIENISDKLGKAHKVRSFYNNIVQPSSDNDVTIDTHAYAAAFMFPHSGTDVGVKALFSSSPMVKNLRKKEEGDIENRSSLVYGLLADVYRDTAKELGVLPRELQSITWEKIRKIFPDSIKSSIKKSLSSAIGEEYGKESYREEAVNNELDSYEWTQYRTDADRRNQEGTAYVRTDTQEGTQLVGDFDSDGDRRGVAETRRPIVSVSFESFNQPKEQRTGEEADFDEIFGEEINFDFTNAGIDNVIEALGLEKRTPSERRGIVEDTKAAIAFYGTVNGEFDKNVFLRNILRLAVETTSANGGNLSNTLQSGMQVAIAILQKEIDELDVAIDGAYARGHTDIAMDLEASRDTAANAMNEIIAGYSVMGTEAGRVLAYRRWQGRTKNAQYYIRHAIRANGGALEKEDLDFITNTVSEMEEIEDEIESTYLDTSEDIEVASETSDRYIEELEKQATKKNAFFKKRVADTEQLINKGLNKLKIVFRAKFGGKEQRIPASGFRGGVIDTENYEGREEQLIARLAEVFVNRAVEEGRKVSPEEIYKEIQDTLVVDKKEFTIDQIKMAIANNTLPFFDLKKQYVAFMALLKIAANADTRVNELAAQLFDIEKETRANPKNVKEFLAELDKLEEALEGLANTLNTIYDDEMVGKIREKIENLKTAAHQVGNPKSSKKARSEAVTKAQEELAELRAIQRLEKQIAELEERLRNNDFTSILNKKKRTKKTEKVLELERKLNALRVKLRTKTRRLEETKQENYLFTIPVGGRKIEIYKYHLADIIGFPRLALTMADMSAVGRQALFLSARHPFIASKVFKDAFMTFFSETTSEEVDIYVRKRAEDYNLEDFDLFIRDIDGGLIQGEEAFTSRLGDKIPVFKTIRRMSERHMVNYLNMLGVEIMVDLIQRHPDLQTNEEAMRAWANLVNIGLGRGDLGKFAGAADQLSLVFFSPRFTMSRIQLAPKSLKVFKDHPELRTEVMTTWLSFLGAGMTVLTLASLAGAEVGDDPEDSDFGKIVIGDRRWDIWAGFQQPFRLLAQAIKKGAVPDDDIDLWRAGSNFVKWKLSPPFGIFHEFVYGEDWVTGQDISKGEAALQSLTPILFQTAIEAHKQELTLFEGATLTIPEFFGVSSGVYEKKNKRSSSSYF